MSTRKKTETYQYNGKIFQIEDPEGFKICWERSIHIPAWDYSEPDRINEARTKGVKIEKDFTEKITKIHVKERINEFVVIESFELRGHGVLKSINEYTGATEYSKISAGISSVIPENFYYKLKTEYERMIESEK